VVADSTGSLASVYGLLGYNLGAKIPPTCSCVLCYGDRGVVMTVVLAPVVRKGVTGGHYDGDKGVAVTVLIPRVGIMAGS
jgi:hypothetical protein